MILHVLSSQEKAEKEKLNDLKAGWKNVKVHRDPKTREWIVPGSMSNPKQRPEKKVEAKEEPTEEDLKALEENNDTPILLN